MSEETNVVAFRKDVPTASFKRLDADDLRATCQHRRVCVGMRDPILECAECQAPVDPYVWIRTLTREWDEVCRQHEEKKRSAEREIEVLKKRLRVLRGEYESEAERIAEEREAERAIAVLPPKRGIRG